jgi:flavin reductase (DIM6/NTAB) family NADH-FMN oxidoreductase RutF
MEIFIKKEQLLAMDQRKRATLINSLGGFKSVCLIGTTSTNGNTNLAIFSSIFHIGANPALIGFIMRPASVDRHTLSNLLETKVYTINHINESIYKKAHQTSASYEKEVSEFDATGLTIDYKNNFLAPFVKESNVQMGIIFRAKIDFTINGTILIIGEITQIYYPSDCLYEDGFLNIEKANTITCSGLDSYHTTNTIARLKYAKPDKEVHIITSPFVE